MTAKEDYLKRAAKEEKEAKRKGKVAIYDTESNEHFYPHERSADEIQRKKEALKAKLRNRVAPEDIDQSILKGMADRVNNAETEEEALKRQERLDKYKKIFKGE